MRSLSLGRNSAVTSISSDQAPGERCYRDFGPRREFFGYPLPQPASGRRLSGGFKAENFSARAILSSSFTDVFDVVERKISLMDLVHSHQHFEGINELLQALMQIRIEKGQPIPTAIEFESPAVVVTV